MAVIYAASSDSHSAVHSSWLVRPLLHFFFPQMPESRVDEINFFTRKCAHLTEYALLAILLWRAFRHWSKPSPQPWSWRQSGLVLLIVFLYAGSDEFHQLFVPTRTAHFTDVLIDTGGGALGLLVVWGIGRWRKRW